MESALRDLVWRRAGHCCEYCRISQDAAPVARFQIEHIRARQHGGQTEAANLALSCPRCNCYKGPNLSAVDPETDEVVSLFHPRNHTWSDHFRMDDAEIVGMTATGRATVQLLRMNDPERINVRRTWNENSEE